MAGGAQEEEKGEGVETAYLPRLVAASRSMSCRSTAEIPHLGSCPYPPGCSIGSSRCLPGSLGSLTHPPCPGARPEALSANTPLRETRSPHPQAPPNLNGGVSGSTLSHLCGQWASRGYPCGYHGLLMTTCLARRRAQVVVAAPSSSTSANLSSMQMISSLLFSACHRLTLYPTAR